MKTTFIKDIKGGLNLSEIFLVKKKNLNRTKNGKYYLAITLGDNTGAMEARGWDNAERLSALFEQGDIIRVKGLSSVYQNRVQLSVNDIDKVDISTVDLSCFVEASKFNPDDMLAELTGYIQTMKNTHLKSLLNLFFEDDSFMKAFKSGTAAKALHHSYLSGLLEHTLSVTRVAIKMVENYETVNRDLLIAGAILHDIGKIKELSSEIGFNYTDSGRLLGHIVIGVGMVDEKLRELDAFPERLADHLKHMILSHHGIYEWGSPKKPKTKEALMLHYADDLDAKMAMFDRALDNEVRDRDTGWTNYNPIFERYLFKDETLGQHESLVETTPQSDEAPADHSTKEAAPSTEQETAPDTKMTTPSSQTSLFGDES
ncbi:3'-5' exoribonuclease YhaM family protein [Thermodesulfobacteriota bacterium]